MPETADTEVLDSEYETGPAPADKRRSLLGVDQATGARAFSYAVLVEVDRLRQRFQRRGCMQGAVRPVQIVVSLVLAQDPTQMVLVPDESTVQELTAASPDPAFS